MSGKRDLDCGRNTFIELVVRVSCHNDFVEDNMLIRFAEWSNEKYLAAGTGLQAIPSFYGQPRLSAGEEDEKISLEAATEVGGWDSEGSR